MADKIAVDEAKIRLQGKSLDDLIALINEKDAAKWTEAEIQAAKQIVLERTSQAGITTAGELKGVKGWLFFFCLVIGVFTPIMAIYNIGAWGDVSSSYYSGIETIKTYDIICSLFIGGFGIYTAYFLWKIKPNAVKIAKMFIIAAGIYNLLLLIMLFSLDLPSSADQIAPQVIVRIIVLACWYSYFNKSRRVKATYAS
jgi:hypothetical protein